MINPNVTPQIDIDEIRSVVEKTTDKQRDYSINIRGRKIFLSALPSVYLSKGY